MKAGLIIFGILVLAIGAGLFFWGYSQLQETSGFLGGLERLLSPTARGARRSAQIMQVGGLITGIIGMGLLVLGVFSRSKD